MTCFELYREVVKSLSKVSECADFEAKCLLDYCYGIKPSDIYSKKEIHREEFVALKEAIGERLKHIPLQYIIGKWQFMDYEFIVDENVLIPRPETEILCECLENKIKANTESVVYDLCSGSGCIAVSVSKMCGAKVYAVEKYSGAFNLLKKNVELNGAEKVFPIQYDILNEPNESFEQADFILSNPPYVTKEEMEVLQPEVEKEPKTALFGGDDGLRFYRAIEKNWMKLLKSGGYIAFEIGDKQEEDLKIIFKKLIFVNTLEDYNGLKRVVIFKKG